MTRINYVPRGNTIRMTSGNAVIGRGLGCGMGSLLLQKGGAGGASSYDGVQDYRDTIGMGLGLGMNGGKNELNKKLESLSITPSTKLKPKNIKFNF